MKSCYSTPSTSLTSFSFSITPLLQRGLFLLILTLFFIPLLEAKEITLNKEDAVLVTDNLIESDDLSLKMSSLRGKATSFTKGDKITINITFPTKTTYQKLIYYYTALYSLYTTYFLTFEENERPNTTILPSCLSTIKTNISYNSSNNTPLLKSEPTTFYDDTLLNKSGEDFSLDYSSSFSMSMNEDFSSWQYYFIAIQFLDSNNKQKYYYYLLSYTAK